MLTTSLAGYALHNRLTPFISMQNQHSALYREEEREVMPMLKHYGVGAIPWGPMATGRESIRPPSPLPPPSPVPRFPSLLVPAPRTRAMSPNPVL